MEANLRMPLGDGEGDAEIVLHEPRVFAIERERWVVRAAGAEAAGDVVTPNLPETRVRLSLVAAELEAAAESSPDVAAVARLLRALGVIGPTGGSVPDAIDHLLHDPASHISEGLADPDRRAQMSSSLTQLLAPMPSVVVDLAARRLVIDAAGTPAERGLLPWTAHVEAGATGDVSANVSIGSPGTTAAGGAIARLQTGPLRAELDWFRSGSNPEHITLWPAPDATALARAAVQVTLAEFARGALETPRLTGSSAGAVLDAAFGTIGLLGSPDQAGVRPVLLPLGLFADPGGWLQHETALGGAGGFSAARVAALLDALKPIVGMKGGPGEWVLGEGVGVTALSQDGRLHLMLRADTSSFAPVSTATGGLLVAGEFSRRISAIRSAAAGDRFFHRRCGRGARSPCRARRSRRRRPRFPSPGQRSGSSAVSKSSRAWATRWSGGAAGAAFHPRSARGRNRRRSHGSRRRGGTCRR